MWVSNWYWTHDLYSLFNLPLHTPLWFSQKMLNRDHFIARHSVTLCLIWKIEAFHFHLSMPIHCSISVCAEPLRIINSWNPIASVDLFHLRSWPLQRIFFTQLNQICWRWRYFLVKNSAKPSVTRSLPLHFSKPYKLTLQPYFVIPQNFTCAARSLWPQI